MDTAQVLAELDALFRSGQLQQLEPFFLEKLQRARAEGDRATVLTLNNELMGYYRSQSRHADCLRVAAEALGLLEELGQNGSLAHAVTLLNVATAYRATGQIAQAIEQFEQVGRMFLALRVQDSFLVASLYNNLALAWQEQGDHAQAIQFLEAALPLSRSRPGAEHDVAVSLTNLAWSRLALGELEAARPALTEALELFAALPQRSGHESAAWAAWAEVELKSGRSEEAERAYETALAQLESRYGKNQAYADTLQSLAMVLATSAPERSQRLLLEADGIRRSLRPHRSGMELARAYYEHHRAALLADFAPYCDRIAVGLVGYGSECLGFDDELSADHDFGPGFCIWLTEADYRLFGAALEAAYQKLPAEFMGYGRRQDTSRSGQRVGVFSLGQFYRSILGCERAPETEQEWWNLPEEALAAACSGEVFVDPLGEFSALREKLRGFYPPQLRRRKLAQAVALLSQAGQYNLPRALKRKQWGAAFLAQAEFLRRYAEALHLLVGRYRPIDKWLVRSVASLPHSAELAVQLESLATCPVQQAEAPIEALAAQLLQLLIREGYTQAGSSFLEHHVDAILGGAL